ncbi:MAG: rhomboid family intramembrane serine protease [Sphingobacteriales bacterium]|jgi:membrane associated rhomboid family serine protease|nr:rhomboid family intramembrane serine protease [Sphingobacteriales bacterium]
MEITLLICAATVLISLAAFNNSSMLSAWMLDPYLVHHKNQWWRMISSGFIHADFMHLFFNMFSFYFFGRAVEVYFGFYFEDKAVFYYLLLYIGGILIANAPTLAKHKNNHWYRSLGASGAVAAVIFTALFFNPWNKIYFFGIIGIPGVLFGPLYLFAEYRMSKQANTGINHDAHFFGAVFGLLFPIMLRPSLLNDFLHALVNPA